MQRRPIYLLSYPRSGNTLARTYFSLLQGRPQPSIYPGDVLLPEHGPLTGALDPIELIKSHHFDPQYQEIIYLVRDGRNAMISHLYMQFLFKGHTLSRLDELHEGLRMLTAQGHFWGDHVAAARGCADTKNVCFIRHEDLVRDPAGSLRTMIRFMGADVTDSAIEEAIRRVRASRTYVLNYHNGFTYKPEEDSIYDLLQRHRRGDYWRRIFDERSRRYFHEQGGTAHLLHFGYEHSSQWWE